MDCHVVFVPKRCLQSVLSAITQLSSQCCVRMSARIKETHISIIATNIIYIIREYITETKFRRHTPVLVYIPFNPHVYRNGKRHP